MTHITWALVLTSEKEQQLSNGTDIAFLSLGGKPVLAHSLQTMEACPDIEGMIVVARKERMLEVQTLSQLFGISKLKKIVMGGQQRWPSLRAGLDQLPEECTLVALHDAVRPLAGTALFTEAIKAAKRYGCAVTAQRATDVIKLAPKGFKATQTMDPSITWVTQSPAVFRRERLVTLLEAASKARKSYPDEAALFEQQKEEVHLVPATPYNLRIRCGEDLGPAEALYRLLSTR